MAAQAQPLDQRIAIDALDRWLAGRIDGCHDHRVGVVEAGAELVEEVAEAGEAVRLDDGDHPPGGNRPRRLEHRGDFDRMVAIVVEDVDTLPAAGEGETPL